MAATLPLPSSLEVRRTEDWGRALYAKTRIHLGTEVLASEPYAHVLSNSERGSVCEQCLQRADNLLRCSGCRFVRYCGKSCQRGDWEMHKAECKGIAAIHPSTPSDTMRLVVRILQRRKKASHQPIDQSACLLPGAWEMELLCSHKAALSEDVKEQLAQQMLGIQKLTEGQEDFRAELAYDVLCKVLCNTFTICDESLNCIGAAIYIGPSALNHSCVPNCAVSHTGSVMHLRAIKSIQPGEQLFISYVDLMDTAKQRQIHLKKVYNFNCTCTRCHEEEEMTEGSPYSVMYGTEGAVSVSQRDAVMAEAFHKLEELEQLKKMEDWSGVVTACQEFLTEQAPFLHTMNIVTAKALECYLLALIELRDWPKALLIAVKLTDPYRQYLPSYHPVLATHMVKLGKLYRLSGTTQHLELSIRDLSKAVDLLSVCFGSNHPTTRQAVEMLQDSQRELVQRKVGKLGTQTT